MAAVLLIVFGAAFVLLGVIITIAGIIVQGRRKKGAEAAPATPDIWTKIVEWILKKLDFLMDKVLKGSVIALGLILIIVGAASMLGGALVQAHHDSKDTPATTTTSTTVRR